jgi:hypothetical protein
MYRDRVPGREHTERRSFMTAHILTDSDFIAALLKRLLSAEERADIGIRAIDELSSMYSLARTWLASDREPVAVVIDADTPSPQGVARWRQSVEEVIGDAAGGVPYKVIIAVPEIEALFFERPEVLRRRFDGAVTDHLLELAQFSARGALRKLAADGDHEKLRWHILKTLTAEDVAALRQSDLIQEVLGFIGLVRRRAHPVAKAGV